MDFWIDFLMYFLVYFWSIFDGFLNGFKNRFLDWSFHAFWMDFLMDFWMDFFIHFAPNLGPNLGPCWPLFRIKRGGGIKFSCLFYCVGFFFRFLRAGPWGTPSDRGPNPMGYPSWARFLDYFWMIFGWFPAQSYLCFSLVRCMGWWGYAKR